jgi:PAS domain S-box-containing protein
MRSNFDCVVTMANIAGILRALTVRDDAGAIIEWFGTNTDIHDRKQTEEQLRTSQERFELAVQGSQDGLWDWDLTRDDFYCSPQHKSMLGYEDHEVPNRREEWVSRIHPEDFNRFEHEILTHFSSHRSHSALEFRMRHKDGSYHWIRSRSFALRDDTGQVCRISGSHVDITDEKNAEAALRASEERYQLLSDAIPQIVWQADLEGANEYLNQRWFQYTGMTPEQSSGGGWLNAIYPDDRANTVTAWENARERGEAFEIEYRLRRFDGSFRWHLGVAKDLNLAKHWYSKARDGGDLEGEAHLKRLAPLPIHPPKKGKKTLSSSSAMSLVSVARLTARP